MADDPARESLIGAWRLVAYEDRDTEDEHWNMPFGNRPLGLAVYGPDGLVSIQILPDPTSPSTETFVGYMGTFVVREAAPYPGGYRGVVEHRMDAASDPDLLGEDPDRPFDVSSDTLTLGDGRTWRRLFTRIL